jgi:hypothetical protein
MKRVKTVLAACADVIADVRQHPFEPRHFPIRGFGEHPLHIGAKVDRVLARRSVR